MPFAFAALLLVPHTTGYRAHEVSTTKEKFKRTDYPGAGLMLVAIILLILGLTLGATNGFKTASFLVPFLLSWILFGAFFAWEWKLPASFALVPPSFWFIPNMPLLMLLALMVYPIWGITLIAFLQRWQFVWGDSPIIAAVRYLPSGISGIIVAVITT